MCVVEEPGIRQRDFALALDVYLARAVDHNLGDRTILQQRIDGAKAHQFAQDPLKELSALRFGQVDVGVLAEQLEPLTDEMQRVRGALQPDLTL